MIDPVLMIVFIALAFILGLTLGAGAIEYDRVEKEGKNHEQKKK